MPRRGKTIAIGACIAALPLVTTSFLLSKRAIPKTQVIKASETHATDPAFRDGLYLGKLDAENGREPHLSTGRWSTDVDRASFKSGYQEGYRQVLDAKAAKRLH